MPDIRSRHAYLHAVEADLGLDPDTVADVLDELDAHLIDSAQFLESAGRTREDAVAEAIRRLGPPRELAREIRRQHQTRRRLLAAVGGGVLGAADGAVRGMVPAIGIWIVASLLGFLVAWVVGQLVGRDLSLRIEVVEQGTRWLLVTSVAFGAARRSAWALARGAHWPLGRSATVVGLGGGAVIASWCLFGPPIVMSAGTIVAEVVVLVAWLAGVVSAGRLPDLTVTRRRLAIASVAPGLLVGGLLLSSPASAGTFWYDGPDVDLTRAGATIDADGRLRNQAANPEPDALGQYMALVGPLPTGSIDPRIELWAALRRDVQSPFEDDLVGDLDPSVAGAVRQAPLASDGRLWSGSIRLDDIRDLDQAWVVVTIEMDGHRVIVDSAPVVTVYRANLAEWLGSFAPGSDHAVPHA
jgi:hypothetical protein